MKTIGRILVACLCGAAASSHATIVEMKQVSIDFTNAAMATNEVTWSDPDKLTVTANGLGWDGDASSSRDGWFKTKPLAVGLSWRTPIAVSVRATVQPPPTEFTMGNGKKATPYVGDVYVRYSPDFQHRSSWQALQAGEPQLPEDKKNLGRHFSGLVRVPYSAREHYGNLLSQYSTLDVPWKSDEEAAVRWILTREPDLFAKELPFIGYVEFLFEGNFYGGQRIRSFRADISYGMSGLASIPKDEFIRKNRDNTSWRFKAEAAAGSSDPMEQYLAGFNSIKPGITRSEVQQKLNLDGGLQGASPVRFVHPSNPYLKMDVEFDFKRDAADQGRAVIGKDDKVVHVSRPYLERPFMD